MQTTINKLAVSFNTLLETPTLRCYVKHPIVKSLSDSPVLAPKYFQQRLYNTTHGKYQYLHQIMLILSWYLSSEELAQVIREGKWYQETEALR